MNLTAFQRDVLRIVSLLDGEPKGLAVKARLEQEYDEEINHGRLYPNLDELQEMGLLLKGQKDERTNAYALTDAGESKLRQLSEKYDSALAATA